MMWMGSAVRAKLNVDLSRYHEHLQAGSMGTLLPFVKVDAWGSEDRFGAVRFDCCGATLDILLASLEIEGAKEMAERERDREREALRTTKQATLYVGPRGGLRGLAVEYMQDGNVMHRSYGDRETIERILGVLEQHGIRVERVVRR